MTRNLDSNKKPNQRHPISLIRLFTRSARLPARLAPPGLLTFTLAALLLDVQAASAQDGAWAAKAPAPTVRQQAGIGAVNGIVYVIGGGCGAVVNTVEAYDPVKDAWTTKAPMPTARDGVAVAVVNGILYAIGGSTSTGLTTAVEAYDPVLDAWSSRSPLPVPRGLASAGVINGIIYVVGGGDGSSYTASVFAYDAAADSWSTKSAMSIGRISAGAGVINGILYVAGGFNGSCLTSVEAYNPGTDTWQTKASMHQARLLDGAGVVNGRLYVAGTDYCGGPSATVESYDPNGDSWTTVSPMPTARRPALAAANNILYAIGGGNTFDCVSANEAFTAAGSTIQVTTTADSGVGSLRNALALAQDGDTIDATSVSGTVVLTSGALTVSKNVTVLGPGAASLAVSGNGASRVFYINAGVTFNVSGLTLRNGAAPGDNGGAIYDDQASLIINNCTLSGNTALRGGALYNNHGLTVLLNSTISGNSSPGVGGGLFNDGQHQGSLPGSASLRVINCTISGNSAAYGGGIFNDGGGIGEASLELLNSTLSRNSGAPADTIYNDGSGLGGGPGGVGVVKVGNTILQASGGANIVNNQGTINSQGYNLSDDATGPNDGSTDKLNTDPMLGPLQDNGGPTFTQALLPGSPAIDAGDPNFNPPPSFDQRGTGYLRVFNGRIDMGAFEAQAPSNHPPVAQCKSVTVSASANCSASASIDNGSYDPDAGDTITLSQSPAGPYPLGNTFVTLTVTDNHGASSQCTALVTVVDNTPPTITCPASQTVEATSPTGAVVVFATPVVSDNCSVASVTCAPASGSSFPVGTTHVTCTARDGSGNSAACGFDVTVLGASQQTTNLINLVVSFNLAQGIQNSLDAKLQNAEAAMNAARNGDLAGACSYFGAFINEVNAQAGNKITVSEANQLIVKANQIKRVIGCL